MSNLGATWFGQLHVASRSVGRTAAGSLTPPRTAVAMPAAPSLFRSPCAAGPPAGQLLSPAVASPLLPAMPNFVPDLAPKPGDDDDSSDEEGSGLESPPDPSRGTRMAAGSLTAGLPTPDSIQRQKEMYARSLENQLKQGVDMLGAAHKQKTDSLLSTANKQKQEYNRMLDEHVKQQDQLLDKQYEQQVAALKQAAAQQRADLDRQAEAIIQGRPRLQTAIPDLAALARSAAANTECRAVASAPRSGAMCSNAGSMNVSPGSAAAPAVPSGTSLAAAIHAASVALRSPPAAQGSPLVATGGIPWAPVARYDAPVALSPCAAAMNSSRRPTGVPRSASRGPSAVLSYVPPTSAFGYGERHSYVPPAAGTPLAPATPGRLCRSHVVTPVVQANAVPTPGGSLNVPPGAPAMPAWAQVLPAGVPFGSAAAPPRMMHSGTSSVGGSLSGSMNVPLAASSLSSRPVPTATRVPATSPAPAVAPATAPAAMAARCSKPGSGNFGSSPPAPLTPPAVGMTCASHGQEPRTPVSAVAAAAGNAAPAVGSGCGASTTPMLPGAATAPAASLLTPGSTQNRAVPGFLAYVPPGSSPPVETRQ